MTVAVLFARADSHYKALPDCDVWDAQRDARRWPGGCPVVAHPPCRAWGQLRSWAKPAPGEIELAPWAVEQVRRWTGVLDHRQPAFSARKMPSVGLAVFGFDHRLQSVKKFIVLQQCSERAYEGYERPPLGNIDREQKLPR